jgi:hypothetical protein
MKSSDELKKRAREAFPDPGLPKSNPLDIKNIAATQRKTGEAKEAKKDVPPDPPGAQKTEPDYGVNGAQEPSPEDRKNKLREKYKDLKSSLWQKPLIICRLS